MNGRGLKTISWACLIVAVIGVTGSLCLADTREEIIDRMAKRLPKLKAYKGEGKIGETYNGLVEAVKKEYREKDKTLRKLVAEENEDRKAFYALTAKKFETTPEIVARAAGIRNFKAAEPKHWLKLKTGKWIQRKDLKVEKKDEEKEEQKD
jgi:uncharacterized protein YdbL (DUF1318 family)